AWRFERVTKEEALVALRTAADTRAETGLPDPREPVTLTTKPLTKRKAVKAPPPVDEEAPVGKAEAKEPERPARSALQTKLDEIGLQVKEGKLTDDEGRAKALEAIEARIAELETSKPTKNAYVERKQLENMRLKLGGA